MKYIKFLLNILNKKEKIKLIYLGFLMLINTLLELFSIGMILPVLSTLFKENLDILPDNFYEIIKNFNQSELIIYLLSFIILIFILKNLFMLFFFYQQGLYARNVQVRIAGELFGKYIFQNYSFFLQKETGTILRNVNLSRSVSLCLSSYLILTLELIIVLSFFMYLLFLNFISTIVISFILGLSGIILYKLTKNNLYNWSTLKQNFEALLNTHIIQSFSLIKNIKIFNKEKKMHDYFNKIFIKHENLNLKIDILQQIPRGVVEILSILALSSIIVILTNEGKNALEVISIIAIYAAITFRLMPSTTRIIATFQRIKTFGPSIELIQSEYLNLENESISNNDEKKQKIIFESLEFKDVSFNYENSSKKILNETNIKITHGDIIGIHGMSGSGKSTMVNLISGLIRPKSGVIKINNKNLELIKKNWLASLGYVPQQVTLFNTTVTNNISFFENQIEAKELKKKIVNTLYKSNSKQFIENLPNREDTLVGEGASKLSGGQIQRIGIARALFNDPEFLIFDESTNSLDKKNEDEIMNTIYGLKGKKTIIIISHNMSVLAGCDKIYEIKNNKIHQTR